MLLQTLEGVTEAADEVRVMDEVAEETDEVVGGVGDADGDEVVSGELEDAVEAGTPNVVTGVNCCSCDDTLAFSYLDIVAIYQLIQRS